MALILHTRHWLAGVGVGCAFIAASLLPPPERIPEAPFTTESAEAIHAARIAGELRRVDDRLRVLEQRDAVAKAVRDRPAPPGQPALHVAGAVPPEVRAAVAEVVAEQWARLQPTSGIGLAVWVAMDTTDTWRSHVPDVNYILPAAFDGRTCVALVRVSPFADGRRVVEALRGAQRFGDVGRARLLGPCAYYVAFGEPGAAMARWLGATRHRSARVLDPGHSPARGGYQGRGMRSAFGLSDLGLYYGADVNVLACARGSRARCEAAALDTTGAVPERRWSRAIVMPGSDRRAAPWIGARNKEWMLSDMVHDLGRERFGQLWRSPRPVPEAFAAAAGEPLGEWTHRWMVARYGGAGAEGGLGLRTLAMSAGVVLAGLLVAARTAERRRVA